MMHIILCMTSAHPLNSPTNRHPNVSGCGKTPKTAEKEAVGETPHAPESAPPVSTPTRDTRSNPYADAARGRRLALAHALRLGCEQGELSLDDFEGPKAGAAWRNLGELAGVTAPKGWGARGKVLELAARLAS